MDLMNQFFMLYSDWFSIVFIDNILIYSKTWQKHATHFKIVLQKLRDHQLYANKEKYDLDD